MPDTLETCGDPKVGLAAEVLRDCGKVRLRAWGTSMLPSLWPGDLLTIQSVARGEVVAGDIVLMLRQGRFLIHRLIEKRQDQSCILWITRGDALLHDDPPTAASELLGIVTEVQSGNLIFVPNRRVSRLHSALAWALCRSNRFRNLTLRIHAARMQAGPWRARRFFRGALSTVPGVAGISPSHTSHS